MKLLLDEMHSPAIAVALEQEGWDVVAVASTPSLRGLPDDALLAHAAAEERILVTENVVDFAVIAHDWAADGRTHVGIIFTNPKKFNRANRAYPGDVIAALRSTADLAPRFGETAVFWL